MSQMKTHTSICVFAECEECETRAEHDLRNTNSALVDALKNFTEGRNNARAMEMAYVALKLAEGDK
jgi:tRNA threonylcarbamoyladenosine modification (KEOPS) complex Cgi121 subunit